MPTATLADKPGKRVIRPAAVDLRTIATSRVDVYEYIGKRVREERMRKKANIDELGAKVGISRASVNNIERGAQRLSIRGLYDLAEALGVSAKDLLP